MLGQSTPSSSEDFRYLQVLEELGLNQNERDVFLFLLRSGPTPAKLIASAAGLSRTNTYNVLESLERISLVRRDTSATRTLFKLNHPSALRDKIAENERLIQESRSKLDSCYAQLLSEFSLTNREIGVFRFEGKEGMYRVYSELVRDATQVNSIVDRKLLRSVISDYNPQYIKLRQKHNIKSRVITPDTTKIDSDDSAEKREVRYVAGKRFPFTMDLKVTERQVVMTTLAEDTPAGIAIIDPVITKNFMLLFEFLWSSAEP
ncbi:MAG: hypothetical protein KDD53_12435 [Bdellovibrionales bacterium]|nr:hypothetical protein [Bdellovibrionales bacterium]